MREQVPTLGAKRAASRIVSSWRVSSRDLADVPSIARIIDEETRQPELLELHVRYEQLLAAFADLLAFAESKSSFVDDHGNLITDRHVDEAHGVLAAVNVDT